MASAEPEENRPKAGRNKLAANRQTYRSGSLTGDGCCRFDATLTAADRASMYNSAFPRYPVIWSDKGWLMGAWNLGNDYKGSGYHGAYAPSYLKRIMSMFPDAKRVLHLFSGSLPPGRYIRVDLRVDPAAGVVPDVQADAHDLPFADGAFNLILSDPPYSGEDAARYGTPMVDRRTVFSECVRVLAPGGNLVWLDMVHPMFRKTELRLYGQIGIVRSTNHRYRLTTIFERVNSVDRSADHDLFGPINHIDLTPDSGRTANVEEL